MTSIFIYFTNVALERDRSVISDLLSNTSFFVQGNNSRTLQLFNCLPSHKLLFIKTLILAISFMTFPWTLSIPGECFVLILSSRSVSLGVNIWNVLSSLFFVCVFSYYIPVFSIDVVRLNILSLLNVFFDMLTWFALYFLRHLCHSI